MKKILAIILATVLVFSLVACGDSGKPNDGDKQQPTYPKFMGKLDEFPSCTTYELYLWNKHTERKVYTLEWVPKGFDKESGEKLPAIIYVHGNTGDANSLRTVPIEMAKSGIAGFSMECCGASNTTPKSDGGIATTSSRASDLDTVFEYVKTLPWVDQNQIYIYGQSHGGMTVMLYAPYRKDEIKGMVVESMGILVGDPTTEVQDEGEVDTFLPKNGMDLVEYYKQFNGDVIICCSANDGRMYAAGPFTEATYNERSVGTAKFYPCPEGGHGINSFSEEGIRITYDAIRELVLGK